MSRKKTTRNASGAGTIRLRSDGRWEAKYTIGRDPGTGKQVRKSVYAHTQGEVRKKLNAIISSIDLGTYQEPSSMTVNQWLDLWVSDYCLNVKPRTLDLYKSTIENRIKPNLGAVKLKKLTASMIQKFYIEALQGQLNLPEPDPEKKESNSPRTRCRKTLSAKTIKNIHGILHKALSVAVRIGAIPANPADCAELPRIERKEMQPLPESAVGNFIQALNDDAYRLPILVDLFTGLRQGELLGLPWSAVDFKKGTITVKQQLQKQNEGYVIAPTKSDKVRVVAPAPFVFDFLKEWKEIQTKQKEASGRYWNNTDNLVFTNELGEHLVHRTIYQHFKKAAVAVGCNSLRFHDLRHSFAIYSLESGVDVKSVQSALGHYSAAFTLDQYCTVTENMQQRNAQRMQDFAESLINKKVDSPKKD